MSNRLGWPLVRAIGLRLLYGLVSVVFVSFVTFLAGEMAPGDAARARVGEKATPEAYQRMREAMGLDRPWPERYVRFVTDAARGEFGRSYFGTQEPVVDIVKRSLPLTARLAVMAILLASALGIVLGTVAAVSEGRFLDKLSLSLSTLGVTLPNFVLAPILVYFFCLQMGALPMNWTPDRVAPDIYYLILPVVVLAARPTATLTRLTRASMLDTLRQEFVKLAVAKGVPPFRLYTVHALRNAVLPVVTAIGTSFGFLLTGSFITETFFTIPGIGSETIRAIQKRDTPVILACVLLTGILFVIVNLIVDVLLPLLDARIRESQV